MKTKLIIGLMTLFFTSAAMACMNDFQCGINAKCVKPSGSYSLHGICVRKESDYGTMPRQWGNSGVTNVNGCQFNTDCDYPSRCLKEAGQIYGVCVR